MGRAAELRGAGKFLERRIARDANELKAAAAKVADQAFRFGDAGNYPFTRKASLLLGAEHVAGKPNAPDLADELAAVAGVPNGRRCNHARLLHAHVIDEQFEAAHGRERGTTRFRGEFLARLDRTRDPQALSR